MTKTQTMLISGETDSSLRADSPESILFAKTSILPLALKELKKDINVLYTNWMPSYFQQVLLQNKDDQDSIMTDLKTMLIKMHSWLNGNVTPFTNLFYIHQKLQQMIVKTSRYKEHIYAWRYNDWIEFNTAWQIQKLLMLSRSCCCYAVFQCRLLPILVILVQ